MLYVKSVTSWITLFSSIFTLAMPMGRGSCDLVSRWSEIIILSSQLVINPLLPKSDLQILLCLTPEDFTLSNARRFYSV